VDVMYGLSQVSESRGRPLCLHMKRSPRATGVSSQPGKPVTLRGALGKPAVAVTIDQPPDVAWKDVEIRISLEWDPSPSNADSRCLLIPESLPFIISRQRDDMVEPQPLPTMQVSLDLPPGVLATSAIYREGSRAGQLDTGLIEMGLIESADVVARPYGLLSRSIVTTAPEGQLTSAERTIEEMIEYFGALTGVGRPGPLLILTERDIGGRHWPPIGSVVVTSAQELGIAEGTKRTRQLELARRIARAWWGGGCHIVGPSGGAKEAGIRTAMALMWLEYSGANDALDAGLEYLRGLTRTSSYWNWLMAGAGFGRPTLVAREALHTYQELTSSNQCRSRLAQLSRDSWGKAIHSRDVSSLC